MAIQQQFVMSKGWTSRLINLAGTGANQGFSHVDCILPSGELFGSRSDKVGGKPPGVQRRPSNYLDGTLMYRAVFTLKATSTQEKAFYDFLFQQEGKPYDKLSILAFVTNRDWRDEGAWFCDELMAGATETAKLCRKLYLPINKLTPTSWALVLSALGAEHEVLPV